MTERAENLGVCTFCHQDVIYAPGMKESDPQYPLHGFDHDAKEDRLYHWACLEPDTIRSLTYRTI